MIDQNRDELSILRAIIFQETRFLRHYAGEVIDNEDPDGKGKVKVQVSELGWSTAANSSWCWPRTRHSMDIPAVGEMVEVYFMAGDPRRPVYLGQAAEWEGNIPESYDGPDKVVLYQDPETGDSVEYDRAAGVFKVGDGSESFVKGDSLDSFLSSLKSWMDTHTHPTAGTGPPSPPTAASPSVPDLKSSKIKGE